MDDVSFDGKLHTMRLLGTFYGIDDNPINIVGLRLLVSHFGEELNKYSRSLRLQRNTLGDPFAQPVQVYSNVESGLGIFAGLTTSYYNLTE